VYIRLEIGMFNGNRIATCLVTLLFCQQLTGQDGVRIQKSNDRAVIEWRARIPAIQKMLEDANEDSCRGAPAPEIVEAFRSTSDGLSVALVDYCSAGAYTDALFPMILAHGTPVSARLRGADGKKIPNEFVMGASAMRSRSLKLAANEKAIYDCFTENDGQGKTSVCGVKAYVWNAKSRTFDLNTRLSKSASAEYCRSVGKGE